MTSMVSLVVNSQVRSHLPTYYYIPKASFPRGSRASILLCLQVTRDQEALTNIMFISLIVPLLCTQVLHVAAAPQPYNAAQQPFLTDSTRPPLELQADNLTVNHHAGFEEDSISYRPSWFTSVLLARRLLALSTSGAVSTIFPDPLPPSSHAPVSVAGHSISLREYIADCDEYLLPNSASQNSRTKSEGHEQDGEEEGGNPTFLALNVGTTFRNVRAGSNNLSLSIDWWDHVYDAGPVYPGFPLSEAGLPRVTLLGYLEPYTNTSHVKHSSPSDGGTSALEECYLRAHPDAKAWLPGRKGSPHSSYWAKMVVTHVYWIGGFGDVQQIGWMNVTEWKGVRRSRSSDGIGDGRGWDDVRLPGESEQENTWSSR